MSAASGHLAPETMLDYARRALEPDDLLSADDHLVSCPDCRSRLVDEAGLRATVASLECEIRAALPTGPDHLPYDQIESLAEDRLRGAAREIAETHAETCASCRAEIADLRDFAAAFRESRRAAAAALVAAAARGPAVQAPGRRPAGAAAAAPSHAADPGGSPGDAPLFSAASGRPAAGRGWRPRPAFIAALVVAVLVGAGAWVLRARNVSLKAEVEDLTRRNEALATRAAEADALRAAMDRQARDAQAGPPRDGGAAAAAGITLKDRGGDVGLDGDGQLTGLDQLPVAEGRAVAAALRHARVEIAGVGASLSLPAPGGDAPVPLSPSGTAVRAQRPTLSWDPIAGAASYSVVVSDESGAVAARADNVRGHAWTVSRPLRRGATYTWRVSAGRLSAATATSGAPAAAGAADAESGAATAAPGAPPGAAARFRVLDHDEAAALDRLLRSARGSALAAGVFYARAGLLDDAEKELRAVLDANPDSPVAKSIVQAFLEQRVQGASAAPATR